MRKLTAFNKISYSLALMLMVAVFLQLQFDVAILTTVFTLLGIGFVKGLLNIEAKFPGVLFDGFVITDTTYAGEAASSFIVKAITGNVTVQGGHVYVKDGIKKKYTIPRFDANFEDFIQDRQATPVSKGGFTVDGLVLEPKDYMIYTEFNPRDYEAHWFATQLNETLIDRRLPATVESVVVQEVLKRHDKYLNKALWNSDTTLTNIYKYYDGFIKKATTGAGTLVVGSPTTLTEANIQAELLKGYNAIPAELRYDNDMKIFCSYATADMYGQSQINQTYKGVDITTRGVNTFKGLTLVPIPDLPNNFYLIAKGNATPSSNMWVGMNSTDDAKLELSKLQNNSELWFIKMLMKVDVQFGWNSEIVLYNGN